MSLTDKVIEELRDATDSGGLVDREEADAWAGEFNRLAATADAPFGAQRMLAVAVVAEVLAIAVAWFGMSILRRWVDVVLIAVFGTAFVFVTGFFAAFAVHKLYREYVVRDSRPQASDGPMSDIAAYDGGQSDLTLYVASAAAGIVNVVLIFVLLSFRTN